MRDRHMKPFFSVVVPLYNKESQIRRCIQSVLAQSVSEFELIIVNDGSTDSSKQIASDYLADPRCHIYDKPNGGLGSARNYGVYKASSPFIAFLDADDEFTPAHLELALNTIRLKSDFIYYSQVLIVREGLTYPRPSRGLLPNEQMSDYWTINFQCVPPQSLVMRTCDARKILWNETRGIPEDFDFSLRAAAEGFEFIFNGSPTVLVHHEFDSNRLSHSFNATTLKKWADENKHMFSSLAYKAYYGSSIAINEPSKIKGLAYFFVAYLRGVFGPGKSARVLGHIILGRSMYIRTVSAMLRIRYSLREQHK